MNYLKQTPLQINQISLLPSQESLACINFRVSSVLAESHQGQVQYLTTVAMVYADDTSLDMAGGVLEFCLILCMFVCLLCLVWFGFFVFLCVLLMFLIVCSFVFLCVLSLFLFVLVCFIVVFCRFFPFFFCLLLQLALENGVGVGGSMGVISFNVVYVFAVFFIYFSACNIVSISLYFYTSFFSIFFCNRGEVGVFVFW